MKYNIISWDITASPYPELTCDCWENTKDEALNILQNQSENSRGIIIDFSTNQIIAEYKFKKLEILITKT